MEPMGSEPMYLLYSCRMVKVSTKQWSMMEHHFCSEILTLILAVLLMHVYFDRNN